MNQPKSRCRHAYENVIHFRSGVSASEAQAIVQDTGLETDNPIHSVVAADFSPEDNSMDVDHRNDHSNDMDVHEILPESSSPYFKVEYPGASKQYGRDATFMEKFDKDKYANQRITNLYYPFSSRDEWEHALFLLRSSMSMKAIDEYIKLQLVRSPVHLRLRPHANVRFYR